jgi:hypothetical protein
MKWTRMMWKTLFILTTRTSTLRMSKNWTASLNMTVGKKNKAKALPENTKLLETL